MNTTVHVRDVDNPTPQEERTASVVSQLILHALRGSKGAAGVLTDWLDEHGLIGHVISAAFARAGANPEWARRVLGQQVEGIIPVHDVGFFVCPDYKLYKVNPSRVTVAGWDGSHSGPCQAYEVTLVRKLTAEELGEDDDG